jgi:hypothetical protein
MANRQRKKSDMATTERREIADKTTRDNRIRNDELTTERRNKADKIMDENRLRNDEMTIHRRKINDRNPWRTLAIVLLLLAALAVGSLLLIFLR